ncbi:hypothetical protein EDB80DRAFT_675802 [Ilyonectria destructans]|nr:hypothetical protein EDB80DRAFT_675802 [Ilyonectria destructans]
MATITPTIIVSWSHLFGAVIAAPINDRWGRKATFWFASFCVLLGGIDQVAVTIHNEAIIVVGLVLIGLGVGQFAVTSLLYIGEVAPLSIRGAALMIFQFLQSWSQLIASALNQRTKGINSSLAYCIPMGGLVVLPLIIFAALSFTPESPVRQQICSILFFYVYGVVFVQAIDAEDPFLVQLITNIIQIFAVGASVLTANKVRRRVNLIITNSPMLVALIVTGGLGTQPLTTASQHTIVIFSFIVVVGFNFGLGPLA